MLGAVVFQHSLHFLGVKPCCVGRLVLFYKSVAVSIALP